MRKRRILSLLLAVAVTATMLIAVPLTASAAIDPGPEVSVYSEDHTFTFVEKDYTDHATNGEISLDKYTKFENGIVFYPGSETSHKSKIATTDQGGYSYCYSGYNGDKGKSALVFEVSYPGKLTIKASCAQPDTGDNKPELNVYNGSITEPFDLTSELSTVSCNVEPGTVYVTSRNTKTDGTRIYEIKYEVSAAADETRINIPETITVRPGSVGTILPQPQNFTEGTDVNNISWSIEESTDGVSINETGAYGLISVDRSVEAKNLTVKATLNDSTKGDITENCTVNIEAGTPTENSWTASAAVKENQYLIYNDDISINTMFAGNTSGGLTYKELGNKEYTSSLNVRYESKSASKIDFKPRDGSTVLVVKPAKDLTLYTVYRRQENGDDTDSYVTSDGKDIKVFDYKGDQIDAASFSASSEAISHASGGKNHLTAYRAAESTFKLSKDKTYYIGTSGTTLNLLEIGYDTNSGFGAMETDSGVYYQDNDNGKKDTEKGIIRFLQKYDGAGVTEYGFYFVDQYGVVKKTTHMSGGEGWDEYVGGFYGDLTEIEEEGYNGPFYALPYVCINGGSPIYGPVGPLDGGAKVDPNHWVEAPAE